jgi:hypothetical protein
MTQIRLGEIILSTEAPDILWPTTDQHKLQFLDMAIDWPDLGVITDYHLLPLLSAILGLT